MTVRIELADGGELLYVPGFLSQADADAAFMGLREMPWEARTVKVYGAEHPQPRLSQWVGDFEYRYSGTHWAARAWDRWSSLLRERAEEMLFGKSEGQFRGVLHNLYRTGKDCIGFHADDEPTIQRDSPIASISLGATRTFVLKHTSRASDRPADVRIPLTHGSCLVMAGTTQRFWKHGVPRELRVQGARINSTFRIYAR